MSLSPEQEDELRQLLADELRSAWRTAVAQGASPAALTEELEERRQAVESSVATGDDRDGLGDNPVEHPGIGELH